MNNMKAFGYVIVTDYIEANTGKDVSDALQKLILDNPNRTIYFPDGEYILAKPVCTPANPIHSVSLQLSTYAVLKAANTWNDEEAMIRLGAAEPYNDISTIGSNYSFKGGIIDGNGIASGISIDSGRETLIREVSIKHTQIGLRVKHGANNGSSDCDIEDVNIVGNGKAGSIGVLVEGFDITFTNMRIASVQYGFQLKGAGNFLRNIHPLYIFTEELSKVYKDSCAFQELGGRNWYNICYSDQFAVGFKMSDWDRSTYSDCFCFWYTARGEKQVGFECKTKFNSLIRGSTISFHPESKPEFNAYITVAEPGGVGTIETPLTNDAAMDNKCYKDYLVGRSM